MSKKRSTRKSIVIACAAAALMLIGGASAYFTSQDAATNTWTVGSVNIDLLEPDYDADDAQNIVPNQTLAKDPQVRNTGTNDAFVFIKFTIPKASVRTASDNGTVSDAAVQELFDYTIDDGWTQVSHTDGADGGIYVYAYAADGDCVALEAGETTPAVFSNGKITFKNIVEGQLGTSLTIPVNAYAIQTSDITASDSTVPADVWAVLSRQADL